MDTTGLNIFGGLAGLGVFAASIGWVFVQFRSGGVKAKDDLIATLKEALLVETDKNKKLVEERTQLITSHQEQINVLNKQMGVLEGKLDSAEKKIDEYKELLQGRNPDQVKFMEYLTDTASQSAKYMESSSKYMKESSRLLKDISQDLKKSRAKNL